MAPPRPRCVAGTIVAALVLAQAMPAGGTVTVDTSNSPTGLTVPAAGPGVSAGAGLTFSYTKGQGILDLEAGTPAEQQLAIDVIAGFAAGGALWSAQFTDPITINVKIDFKELGAGILGSAGSETLEGEFAPVKAALAADALTADDALAVGNFQGGAAIDMITNDTSVVPSPRFRDNDASGNNSSLDVHRGNMKALGLLAGDDPDEDSSITFSSKFTWDFDRSDGISSNAFDFVGVAAHELGHAMGYASGVDVVDYFGGSGPEAPLDLDEYRVFSVLDLYRYSPESISADDQPANGAVQDWAFAGSPHYSLDGGATLLAPFSSGKHNGNGRQASHWHDSLGLGIMDPTFAPGELGRISALDIQAFDVIGFDPVGDPDTITWDGADPGEWTSAHWNPGPAAPDPGLPMVVNSGTVTVSSDLTAIPAASLAIALAGGAPGGTVSIAPAGTLAVTGDVNVGVGGILSVDGVLTASAVNVWGGSLTSSSASAGTATVRGNVILTNGATFAVDVIDAAIDTLSCTGTVTLDRASLDITLGGPAPALLDTMSLVSAGGGLDGIFDHVDGVLHGVNQAFALTYQSNGVTVTVVRPGDFEVDGDVDFSDFSHVAANYGQAGKSWGDGDCDGDGTVDFADFTYVSANYGSDYDSSSPAEAPSAGAAELHVDVVTGEMWLVGDAATLSGYSITSAANSLVPDGGGTAGPFQLYLSNLPDDITAASVGAGVLIDGELALDAACDPSAPMDLAFSYGIFGQGGSVSGQVIAVPEPTSLALLGLGGLALVRRRRSVAGGVRRGDRQGQLEDRREVSQKKNTAATRAGCGCGDEVS